MRTTPRRRLRRSADRFRVFWWTRATRVTADQPLLYVSSPDVANAISTYRKARNHQDYTKKALDRSKDLLDHKVIATKDLEAAEQDYNDAGSDVENSLQALKIFGVTQQEIDDAQRQGVAINPQLAVRSPIAGVVVQKLVSPGLVIQAGMTRLLHHQRRIHGLGAGTHLRPRPGVDSRRRHRRGNQLFV